MTKPSSRPRGFTIVELLIVVVVIAILAIVTVFAYNGIVSRSRESQLISDAHQSAVQLELDKTTNGGLYPTSIDSANGGKGLKASNGDMYQYTVNNSGTAPSFCLSVTNPSYNGAYYVGSSALTPAKGLCSGHTQSPPTNSLTPPQNTTNITMSVPSTWQVNMAYSTTVHPFSSATGTPTPSIQWQMLTPKNSDTGTWVDLAGQTSSDLSYPYNQGGIYIFSQGDYGYFRIKCTNSSGTAYSNAIYTTFVFDGD